MELKSGLSAGTLTDLQLRDIEENGLMTGQTIFIDGGADVVLRGDSTW
jgi:hypothetical protein